MDGKILVIFKSCSLKNRVDETLKNNQLATYLLFYVQTERTGHTECIV